MKYMAIIDADEKPVSCEFIGCNGNVSPHLIGATDNIKALEQEPILDKIRVEIEQKIVKRHGLNHTRSERDRNDAFLEVLEIIDEYKAESRG